MQYYRLWVALGLVVLASFAMLGYFSVEVSQNVPTIPARAVSTDGKVLFKGQDIRNGQNVWQSMGSQEVGTVWGHGAYVAPDWSADWLHRAATAILDDWARSEHGMWYARSADFLQTDLLQNLHWPRAIGDTVFAVSFLALGWFIAGLTTGWSMHQETTLAPGNTGSKYSPMAYASSDV